MCLPSSPQCREGAVVRLVSGNWLEAACSALPQIGAELSLPAAQ